MSGHNGGASSRPDGLLHDLGIEIRYLAIGGRVAVVVDGLFESPRARVRCLWRLDRLFLPPSERCESPGPISDHDS